MKKQFTRKTFFSTVALLQIIFLVAPFSALAKFSIPSAASIAQEMESRYHVNLESIQGQAESFNTSDNKKMAPQIILSFDPTSPTFGQKITATATPIYFGNQENFLYFTWYLKHKKDNKDWNGDGHTNLEDWKIEAMRILANDGLNTNNFNYSPGPQSDGDGYEAHFGGDNKEDMSDHCYIHDFSSGIDYELVDKNPADSDLNCPNGGTPICVSSGDTISPEVGGSFESGNDCKKEAEGPYCTDEGSSDHSPRCLRGIPVCSLSTAETLSEDETCADFFSPAANYTPTCDQVSSNKTPSFICEHLFPHAPGNTTGDGRFSLEEEKFWGTNPEDPDTSDRGQVDEAIITGLGQNTFSWNYQPGDKIGVVIEGTGLFPSKYNDSSTPVMWAFAKNKCDVDTKNNYIYKSIKGYSVKIYITKKDLDGCLEDNLVDPQEGGQDEKLDISLLSFPENPANDSSEENKGDELTISSSILNAKNRATLKYNWTVYATTSSNLNSDWGDPLLKSEIPDVGQTSGIGLSTLKFKLNFKKPAPKFLKISLGASENISADITNEGRAEIILPISSSENTIQAYSTAATDSFSLTQKEERCKEGIEKALCPVLKNELLLLKVNKENFSDFSWSVNGAPLNPFSFSSDTNTCSLGECAEGGENTNIAYLPILEDVGKNYSVSLSASNSNGEQLQLTKNFQVTDPSIQILSNDKTTVSASLLGYYVDPINANPDPVSEDTSLWPDYSTDELKAVAGAIAQLKPVLNGLSPKDISWLIDGVEINNDTAGFFGATISEEGILSFPVEKKTGDEYVISVKSLYTQDTATKKLLNFYWDLQLTDFYEKEIEKKITLKVVDFLQGQEDSTTAINAQNKKPLASLIAAAPEYIYFLFKLILTSFIILLFSGTILSFFPKPNEE